MKVGLEQFRPKLKAGRLIPSGRVVIFEVDQPYDQIVLPVAMSDFVAMSSGEFTVRQMIENIYRKQGSVPFKALLDTILRLYHGGFFENAHELTLSSELQGWTKQKKRKWSLDWTFGQRLVSRGTVPGFFYFATLGLIVASGLGLLNWPSSTHGFVDEWMARQHSLWVTLFKIFAINSMVLTVRHWVSAAQMLMLKGKVYELSLRFSPWGIYLHMSDENTELLDNRLFVSMLHLSQILFPWALVPALGYLEFRHMDTLIISAMGLTIWELNPLANTRITALIRSLIFKKNDVSGFYDFESSDLKKQIFPEQARSEKKFITYSHLLGLGWTSFMIFGLHLIGQDWGSVVLNRLLHIQDQPVHHSLVYWLVALSWTSLATLCSIQLIRSIACFLKPTYFSRLRPMREYLHKRISVGRWTKPELTKTLSLLPMFSEYQPQHLSQLIDSSTLLTFNKGQTLYYYGDPATAIQILLEGHVSVQRRVSPQGQPWVTHLEAISIFGDSALIGDQARSAQIEATADSLVLSVPVDRIEQLAAQAGVLRQLEVYRNKTMVTQFFSSSPVFRSLSPETIDYLAKSGQMEFYDQNQTVFRQGDVGDSLYLVLRGSVDVLMNSAKIRELNKGAFFGEIALIANIPRTATIQAREPCVLFRITSDTFWGILVNHFDLGVFIESISVERLREGLRAIRESA